MLKKPSKTASLTFEHTLWTQGRRLVAGVDEAGRGPWAGPVSAGVVCLPPDHADLLTALEGVRDSKTVTARARLRLVDTIRTTALAWGIGSASSTEIDRLRIVPATCLAIDRALDDAKTRFPGFEPDFLLIDSIKCVELQVQYKDRLQPVVKGDKLSLSIAAASILAKVWRDEHMLEMHKLYPEYEFASNKGYGTARHQAALKAHGVTPIHRMSFRPVSAVSQPTSPALG